MRLWARLSMLLVGDEHLVRAGNLYKVFTYDFQLRRGEGGGKKRKFDIMICIVHSDGIRKTF